MVEMAADLFRPQRLIDARSRPDGRSIGRGAEWRSRGKSFRLNTLSPYLGRAANGRIARSRGNARSATNLSRKFAPTRKLHLPLSLVPRPVTNAGSFPNTGPNPSWRGGGDSLQHNTDPGNNNRHRNSNRGPLRPISRHYGCVCGPYLSIGSRDLAFRGPLFEQILPLADFNVSPIGSLRSWLFVRVGEHFVIGLLRPIFHSGTLRLSRIGIRNDGRCRFATAG